MNKPTAAEHWVSGIFLLGYAILLISNTALPGLSILLSIFCVPLNVYLLVRALLLLDLPLATRVLFSACLLWFLIGAGLCVFYWCRLFDLRFGKSARFMWAVSMAHMAFLLSLAWWVSFPGHRESFYVFTAVPITGFLLSGFAFVTLPEQN